MGQTWLCRAQATYPGRLDCPVPSTLVYFARQSRRAVSLEGAHRDKLGKLDKLDKLMLLLLAPVSILDEHHQTNPIHKAMLCECQR